MFVIEVFRDEPVFFYVSILVLGLIVGSFLNVIIYRLPLKLKQGFARDCSEFLQEEQLLPAAAATQTNISAKFALDASRSHCPRCGHQIAARDNIPVFSYLLLRGRCRHCHQGIGLRYPSVEALSALMGVTVAWWFGVNLAAVAGVLLTWALLALTFIDLDHLYLPDNITLPFLWLGLLLNLNGTFVPLSSAVIGAVAGYLLLWSVYQLFKYFTGKEGMGYGDFKLLAMLGAWFGWQSLPAIILISSLVGTAVGVALILGQKHERSNPIPFGPYLAAAGWIVMLWGDTLAQWYFRWSGLSV